jgi:hypothetical protein
MRARFNSELDGDMGSLIFKHLTRLDLCLSRAVCRDWWRLIPKQTLGFKDDFLKTLVEYDRLEYVYTIERYTLFPKKSCFQYFDDDIVVKAAEKNGAIYSYLLFCRIGRRDVQTYHGIWRICKRFPHLWDGVFLSVLFLNSILCVQMFWNAVYDGNVDFLDWLNQKRLLGDHLPYFTKNSGCIEFNDPIEDMFESLRHLYAKNYMENDFWKTYSSIFWQSLYESQKEDEDEDGKRDIESFLKLIEICKEVPEDACDQATPEEHAQFSHLCGCEKVVSLSFKNGKHLF